MISDAMVVAVSDEVFEVFMGGIGWGETGGEPPDGLGADVPEVEVHGGDAVSASMITEFAFDNLARTYSYLSRLGWLNRGLAAPATFTRTLAHSGEPQAPGSAPALASHGRVRA